MAREDDQVLEEAVNKEMDSHGHAFTDWEVKGQSKMWAEGDITLGVTSKSHHVQQILGLRRCRRLTRKTEQMKLTSSLIVQPASEAMAEIDISFQWV